MEEKLSVYDMAALISVVTSDDYSFKFKKQLIHELDTALASCNGSTKDLNKIAYKILKEDHGPSNQEVMGEFFKMIQTHLDEKKEDK